MKKTIISIALLSLVLANVQSQKFPEMTDDKEFLNHTEPSMPAQSFLVEPPKTTEPSPVEPLKTTEPSEPVRTSPTEPFPEKNQKEDTFNKLESELLSAVDAKTMYVSQKYGQNNESIDENGLIMFLKEKMESSLKNENNKVRTLLVVYEKTDDKNQLITQFLTYKMLLEYAIQKFNTDGERKYFLLKMFEKYPHLRIQRIN